MNLPEAVVDAFILANNQKSTRPRSICGINFLKLCVLEEFLNPVMNEARLLLIQCERKRKKYKRKYPCFKTTRPIASTGNFHKIKEHICFQRIEKIITEVTSKCNVGFKKGMTCEL